MNKSSTEGRSVFLLSAVNVTLSLLIDFIAVY